MDTNLVDHVTFGVPTLVAHVSVYLYELLQDCTVAASTLCCEAGGVVKMTVDIAIVLVIRVLRPEESRAERAGKVLYMKLLVCRRDEIVNIRGE